MEGESVVEISVKGQIDGQRGLMETDGRTVAQATQGTRDHTMEQRTCAPLPYQKWAGDKKGHMGKHGRRWPGRAGSEEKGGGMLDAPVGKTPTGALKNATNNTGGRSGIPRSHHFLHYPTAQQRSQSLEESSVQNYELETDTTPDKVHRGSTMNPRRHGAPGTLKRDPY